MRIMVVIVLTLITSIHSFAQGRLKAGIGFNYISNSFEAAQLYDYGSGSFHLSYALVRSGNFRLMIESNTSMRNKQANSEKKFGFTSSLPIVAGLEMKKILLHAGAGPAYLKQTYEGFAKESVSEYYLATVIGAGINGAPLFGQLIRPEYNIRFSYFKHTQNSKLDAGMISFIIFLKQ